MSKRIVILCDGTWNWAGQKSPTNVEQFAKAVALTAPDGTVQIPLYREGVGRTFGQRLRGGAFGLGLSKKVLDSYSDVVHNYEPGDELFLLGFSRGAFTARSLSGLIRHAGILRNPNDELMKQAYELYRTDKSEPDTPAAVAFRREHALSDVTPIRFIGVWDTVGALGIPNLGVPNLGLPFHKPWQMPWTRQINERWAFHDLNLSTRVQSAFQALAIDEDRQAFTPALWRQQPQAVGQQLEQVWFSGDHCDIGGGHAERGLADITLHWMKERAGACGLAFKEEPLPPSDPTLATSQLHNSRNGFFHLFAPFSRHIGDKHEPDQFASSTAIARHKANGYAPENLKHYLAGPHNEMPV